VDRKDEAVKENIANILVSKMNQVRTHFINVKRKRSFFRVCMKMRAITELN